MWLPFILKVSKIVADKFVKFMLRDGNDLLQTIHVLSRVFVDS